MDNVGASGLLQVVATPLGNLDDLSPRGRAALSAADAIAAEDTRRTARLLQLLGLPKKPLLAYYAPKEAEKIAPILARLGRGQTIVLVTDGGTPGVSDPGALLVAAAREAGARVEPIPGPSAVAMALSVSSWGSRAFVFEGFLARKGSARGRRLAALAQEKRTIVVYEAPHRLAATLADLRDSFGGERRATLVREGTKRHEEICESSLAELASTFAAGAKGEIVLVIEGQREPTDPLERVEVSADQLLDLALGAGLSAARAAREVATLAGLPRNALTRRARERQDGPG